MDPRDNKEVLLFSDDPLIGKMLNYLLTRQGLSARVELDKGKAFDYVKTDEHGASLLIYDLNFNSGEDLSSLQLLNNPESRDVPPRIIISNHNIDLDVPDKDAAAPCFYFRKPFSTRHLLDTINDILR